jgi:hypothetical protein
MPMKKPAKVREETMQDDYKKLSNAGIVSTPISQTGNKTKQNAQKSCDLV